MRLTTLLLLIGCLCASAKGKSQTVSISAKGEQISVVLEAIKKQTGFVFFYRGEDLDGTKPVTVDLKNVTLQFALEKVLRGNPLNFEIQGNTVFIIRKNSSEDLPRNYTKVELPAESFQQSVSGKITDAAGAPIEGVTVSIRGKSVATMSDKNGQYTITAGPKDVLLFKMIGYASQEINVDSKSRINVSMKLEAKELEGVVVTGFQDIQKKKFTGAATKLNADEMRLDGIADAGRMLEGRVAGVSVQNVSGTFGSTPKIRIRGATSLTGDNKPLWVVDGVVLEDIVDISADQLSSGDPTTLLGSSVAGLNANDIESFNILKDAAATAMYGARAMNGVVVITTKKGKKGVMRLNYVGNFSQQLKPSYDDFNIMNSADQMSLYTEMQNKGLINFSDISNANTWGVFGKMANAINAYDPTTGFGLKNTPEDRAAFLKRYASVNTDWFDILFRNNFLQEHSISMSSGTEKSNNYLSVSYYGDNGWTIADKVKRYTLNFRNNINVSDKVNLGFQTVSSYRTQQAPGSLGRQSNPVEGTFNRDFDINPFSYALNTSRTITAYDQNGDLEYFQRNYAPFNIINEVDKNKLNIDVIDVKLQGNLGWKINKNFRYELLGAMRYVKSLQEHKIMEGANMAEAYRAAGTSTIRNSNRFLYRDPDNPDVEPVVVLPYGGFYNRTENALLNWDLRNTLYYNTRLGQDHTIDAFVGQQTRLTNRQNTSTTGYGYQYNQGGIPFVDYRILKQTIEANFPYYTNQYTYDRFAAFYGSVKYSFKNKYNFGLDGRYDGSNRMGANSTARWLPTGTVSASWNISDEPFMENIPVINLMALRTSYGLTASMGNATNSDIILQNILSKRPYREEKETQLELESLKNADLTWEKNHQFNIGLDVNALNNRITLSTDVYFRKGFDLINIVKTSGIGGQLLKVGNVADMKSNGVEVLLTGIPVKTKDFQWTSTATFGFNQTKVTRAENNPQIFDLVQPEGYFKLGFPFRGLYSIDFKYIDKETGVPVFINEANKESQKVFLQGDSTQYLVYEGPVDAPYTGGWNNSFRYKNFTLNLYFTYAAGNKIRLNPIFDQSYNDWDALPKDFIDRWTLQTDERYTIVPSIMDNLLRPLTRGDGAYPYNAYNYSTARVANGDFIRLKSISLQYNVPDRLLKRTGLTGTSIMASAYNLGLLYSDDMLKGQDPEFFNTGGVAQPIQKQFTLTLRTGL